MNKKKLKDIADAVQKLQKDCESISAELQKLNDAAETPAADENSASALPKFIKLINEHYFLPQTIDAIYKNAKTQIDNIKSVLKPEDIQRLKDEYTVAGNTPKTGRRGRKPKGSETATAPVSALASSARGEV